MPESRLRRLAAGLLAAARSIPEFAPSTPVKSLAAISPATLLFEGLLLVPEDWMPKSPHDWLCALAVVAIARNLHPDVPMAQSLRHVGGHWRRLCAAIGRHANEDEMRGLGQGARPVMWSPPRHGLDLEFFEPALCNSLVRDMVAAFATQVVIPLAERFALLPPHAPDDCRRLSAALLTSDKGLAGIFELAARWHARVRRMDHAIRAARPAPSAITWLPGIPMASFDVGTASIAIVPLLSEAALIAEGSAWTDVDGVAGLDHCVGGSAFVERCLAGRSRIVSVRAVDGDGQPVRLSTAEFTVARTRTLAVFSLAQHRGRRNAAPPPEAAAAIQRYLYMVNAPGAATTSDLDADPDALAAANEALDDHVASPAAIEKALRTWEPLLPRPLRGLPLDGFVARIRDLRAEEAAAASVRTIPATP